MTATQTLDSCSLANPVDGRVRGTPKLLQNSLEAVYDASRCARAMLRRCEVP
jgi:hypothetical protein